MKLEFIVKSVTIKHADKNSVVCKLEPSDDIIEPYLEKAVLVLTFGKSETPPKFDKDRRHIIKITEAVTLEHYTEAGQESEPIPEG